LFFVFFFFFQAEDGIRDLIVTGVQTCALPISMLADTIRTACTVRMVSASMAWARLNLSSGVRTPINRFFAFRKSFTGKRSARIGRLVSTFRVYGVSFCPCEAQWWRRRWRIILRPFERPANLVGCGSLSRRSEERRVGKVGRWR